MIDYVVTIRRRDLWRVLDMPGLAQIDLDSEAAVLTFTTGHGCEPCGEAFLLGEVARMGALPVSWSVVPHGDNHEATEETR